MPYLGRRLYGPPSTPIIMKRPSPCAATAYLLAMSAMSPLRSGPSAACEAACVVLGSGAPSAALAAASSASSDLARFLGAMVASRAAAMRVRLREGVPTGTQSRCGFCVKDRCPRKAPGSARTVFSFVKLAD